MKKLIVALTVAFAFLISPIGDEYSGAKAGWEPGSKIEKFLDKRKEARAERKAKREAKKKSQVSPGVFTKERTKFGDRGDGGRGDGGKGQGDRGRGPGDRDHQNVGQRDGGHNWDRDRGDNSRDRYRPGYRPGYRWHNDRWYDDSGAIIGGIIIGSWISNLFNSEPKEEEEEVEDEPTGDENVIVIKPWSSEWYEYCNQKYKSFDAKTGFYTDLDGKQRFCK